MVAWEKQIEERSVPAWRDKYVAYARLKRKLEALKTLTSKARDSEELHHDFSRSGMDTSATFHADELLMSEGKGDYPTRGLSASFVAAQKKPLLEEGDAVREEEAELLRMRQNDFMEAVDQELERVGNWYQEKVTALEANVNALLKAGSDAGGAAGLISGQKPETASENVADLHLEAVRLTEFVILNVEALRKIVKKMDKQCKTSFQKNFVDTKLKRSPLASNNSRQPFNGERARACRRTLEQLVSPERLEELRSQAMSSGGAGLSKLALSTHRTLIAVALALAVVPMCHESFHGKARARRCVGLMVFTVTMWVSEAAPFEATAMAVAPLAVLLSLLEGTREDQAKKLLSSVFNESLYLVLSGFVISSVFAKCQLDCRAAAFLQSRFGNRPFAFMLAIMFLGAGLSALVSNVTAPLLLVEVLKPLLRDLPTDSRYSRALLLALAFSCNIGGMMTPISSPQNVASLEALRQHGQDITWFQWLLVSIPFCSICILVAFAMILVQYRYDISEEELAHVGSSFPSDIPDVVFEREDLTTGKIAALAGASATLVSFACAPIANFFGGTSALALLFVAVALGTGAISRQTFNAYSWHLLFLIGGGSALGLAVRESGLMDILAGHIKTSLATSPWLLVVQLVMVLVGATTFVSHTVAALVFMPLVVQLGDSAGVAQVSVLVGAFACSAACALPMTSFPNVNSLMALDDVGKPWLSVRHFLTAGTPTTLALMLLLMTVGYQLASLVISPIEFGTADLA